MKRINKTIRGNLLAFPVACEPKTQAYRMALLRLDARAAVNKVTNEEMLTLIIKFASLNPALAQKVFELSAGTVIEIDQYRKENHEETNT